MRGKPLKTFASAMLGVATIISVNLFAQQDWDSLKVPDGLSFSEFKELSPAGA